MNFIGCVNVMSKTRRNLSAESGEREALLSKMSVKRGENLEV